MPFKDFLDLQEMITLKEYMKSKTVTGIAEAALGSITD